ncbi:MAG: efflux RND transporter periplasmic adaptor subunit [Rhizobiales bacterium]|nr:efflux RND transporter periplasmic adaptor subunit [Hyphomicrobiales bacterium]
MAIRWTRTLALTGTVLGGAYLVNLMIDPANGKGDTNERLKRIVQTVAAVDTRPSIELSSVEIAKVQPMDLVERVRVSGELRPINQAILRARNGGSILQFDFREGQAVRAGDVLAKFETEDLQSVLKQREAEREGAMAGMLLAIQSLNRMEQLTGKNVTSQEQLDKAKSEVASAKARLDSLAAQAEIARTALRDAEVLAPFDGVVSKLSVNQGARVGAEAELLTVVDISVVEARVMVSTRDVSRVAAGQAVELAIDGFEDQIIQGEVSRISPAADDGSRFVAVYVRLTNDDDRLRGGMFATGSILVRRDRDAIIIPITSLRKDDKGDYVLKLEAGVLVRQPVTVMSKWRDDEKAHISGLTPGDTIVTAPLPEFQPNLAVTITKAG